MFIRSSWLGRPLLLQTMETHTW